MSRRDGAAGTSAPKPPGGPARAPAQVSAPAPAAHCTPSAVFAGCRAWLGLAALLGVGAVLAFALPSSLDGLLDGQPGRWLAQPWRLWTAAWVHWTPMHLAANAAGLLVLALYGCAAEVRPREALAWALAWPLTHLALALWTAPPLPHYGGLSGVLHAGVAVASMALLARRGRWRAVGAAVWLGLLAKLWAESPWWPWSAGAGGIAWDVAIAPQAHAAGVAAGLLGALAVGLASRQAPR
ncbi:rhombosortase [Azohydromonas lata]|uniref:rhombosortase n=1 Tax=Azohydromonas lata TaxID=45677 RepID=UPI000835B32F|nr:rhombosortase [Azohydromonas lata]